jgi:hypothetical protein
MKSRPIESDKSATSDSGGKEVALFMQVIYDGSAADAKNHEWTRMGNNIQNRFYSRPFVSLRGPLFFLSYLQLGS